MCIEQGVHICLVSIPVGLVGEEFVGLFAVDEFLCVEGKFYGIVVGTIRVFYLMGC